MIVSLPHIRLVNKKSPCGCRSKGPPEHPPITLTSGFCCCVFSLFSASFRSYIVNQITAELVRKIKNQIALKYLNTSDRKRPKSHLSLSHRQQQQTTNKQTTNKQQTKSTTTSHSQLLKRVLLLHYFYFNSTTPKKKKKPSPRKKERTKGRIRRGKRSEEEGI